MILILPQSSAPRTEAQRKAYIDRVHREIDEADELSEEYLPQPGDPDFGWSVKDILAVDAAELELPIPPDETCIDMWGSWEDDYGDGSRARCY